MSHTLALAILIFGAILVGLEAGVMIFRGKGWGPQSIRLVGLTVIVIAIIFLAVSGISAERLTPAYALLGVIAGYLVGREKTDQAAD